MVLCATCREEWGIFQWMLKSLFIKKEVKTWSWLSKEQFAWNALVKIPEGEGFKV